MLHTGMPIKCASLNAVGSYDTHSDEVDTLSTNLEQTAAALVAFQRDLEARKLDQRVLIQLWSEFGRRPQENGSGTDHGAGGVAFLIGSRAAGKMVGEFPGLSQTGRKRKRPQHVGLPRDVLLAFGAVVSHRSGPCDPRSVVVRHGPSLMQVNRESSDDVAAPHRRALPAAARVRALAAWRSPPPGDSIASRGHPHSARACHRSGQATCIRTPSLDEAHARAHGL